MIFFYDVKYCSLPTFNFIQDTYFQGRPEPVLTIIWLEAAYKNVAYTYYLIFNYFLKNYKGASNPQHVINIATAQTIKLIRLVVKMWPVKYIISWRLEAHASLASVKGRLWLQDASSPSLLLMGKGKKKAKKSRSPTKSPSSSPPSKSLSSSPPLKENHVTVDSPMTTNSNPASPTAKIQVDASKPASDAQIADLVAQQTDSDSDFDSEIGSSSNSTASDDSKLETPSAPVIAPVADPDTTNKLEGSTKTVNLITELVTPEIALADPELTTEAELEKESLAIPTLPTENTTKTTIPTGETQTTTEAGSKVPCPPPKDSYISQVKGIKQLKKTGESFILPSGEACVKIPNSVIEKNRRSWDCFVLGQFYVNPPSQGTIHNIANGI